MTELRTLPVPDALVGERLDAALARMLGISRTRAAELADAGAVTVAGAAATKSTRLPAGGWVSVELPEVTPPPAPQPVPGMTVHYEDADIIVVDKPAGVAAHGSPGWEGPTVVGALGAGGHTLAAAGPAERQGIVHRLDAGTSGLMVVAKSLRAYTRLKADFKARTVTRTYHALLQGNLTTPVGTIAAPIGRHPGQEFKMAVVTGGKDARTHYEVIEVFRHATLVRAHLETGRTHQIRVHMAAIGHPCLGDPTYNPTPHPALARQWLHAVEMAFDHPGTGEHLTFTSPYPQDLQAVLAAEQRPGVS